jgi:hypothetical protein
MIALTILSGLAVSFGLASGANYSQLGTAYTSGAVQRSVGRIVNEVTAAYAASGSALVAKPADLFPSPRFVPQNNTTSWTVTSTDATDATLCVARTVTSRDDWAATVQGFSLAKLSIGADATCNPGTRYAFPAQFPVTLYGYKAMTRAAPTAPTAPTPSFSVSGLSSTGVANLYGFWLLWGSPLAVTITPANAIQGGWSLTSSSITPGFGLQTTCTKVPPKKSCVVYLYFAGLTLAPVTSGKATLTFSTGDTLTIPLSGHLAW